MSFIIVRCPSPGYVPRRSLTASQWSHLCHFTLVHACSRLLVTQQAPMHRAYSWPHRHPSAYSHRYKSMVYVVPYLGWAILPTQQSASFVVRMRRLQQGACMLCSSDPYPCIPFACKEVPFKTSILVCTPLLCRPFCIARHKQELLVHSSMPRITCFPTSIK